MMGFEKQKQYRENKKKETEEENIGMKKQIKKKKDRLRYLLKKEASNSISNNELGELQTLQKES